MYVASNNSERGPLILAAATLALAGVMLLYVSWQNVQRQREAVDRHMLLTAKSVLRSVEGSLRMGMGRMMRQRPEDMAFRPGMRRLLQELEESGDVLFVGVFEQQAGRIISLRDDANARRLELSPLAITALREQGEWHGMIRFGDLAGFTYGRRARRGVQRLFEHHGGQMREEARPAPPEVYIIVGLDAKEHLAVYRSFRRNAMFHTAYVLAAAMLVWFLAVGFMRRRTLAGRAASLERFQSRLLDNIPDGLLTVSGAGVILSANPAAHFILCGHAGNGDNGKAEAGTEAGAGDDCGAVRRGGSEDSVLVGRSCGSLALSAGACLQLDMDSEPTWKQYEFQGRSLEILSLPLPEGDGCSYSGFSPTGRMVLIRDRTKMRTMEKHLGEAQRLAAIGRLAAGVAHEIRNPLSALRGFAQLFAKKFTPNEPEKEYADTMVREADRLNRVITDLLFLSKPRSVEPSRVDLAELADELERLLEMDLSSHGVTLRTRFDAPAAHVDRDLLKQALLNMILNSVEAMSEEREEGGKNEAGGDSITLASRQTVDGVEISVLDDGPGMAPDQLENVFEPFYTGRRNGTGLGLAFVRKTARDHGGEAMVESPIPAMDEFTGGEGPQRGCAVHMLFPDPVGGSGPPKDFSDDATEDYAGKNDGSEG